jgi:hypothetical protein
MVSTYLEAFLEGFTGGSLFFEAKHPAIPDRLFVPEEREEAEQDTGTI